MGFIAAKKSPTQRSFRTALSQLQLGTSFSLPYE